MALSEDGRHHRVLRAEDARIVGEEDAALQFLVLRAGVEGVGVDLDFGPERPEALEVHLDRPLSDDVAAGRWAGGLAEAPKKRAHHKEAAPQRADEIAVRARGGDVRGVDAQRVVAGPLDGRAEAAQHKRHLIHVVDMRDVLKGAVVGDQEAGRHRAERCVLGAADIDDAS
ncbi:MAG: hypothetical protein AAB092_06810 [Chloroflexota bacterium]